MRSLGRFPVVGRLGLVVRHVDRAMASHGGVFGMAEWRLRVGTLVGDVVRVRRAA